MKSHHYLLLGIAIGLVLGALSAIYLRKPCPELPTVEATPAEAARATQRDSIEVERAIRRHLLDSIDSVIRTTTHESRIKFVRSLTRQRQLDSARAEPT